MYFLFVAYLVCVDALEILVKSDDKLLCKHVHYVISKVICQCKEFIHVQHVQINVSQHLHTMCEHIKCNKWLALIFILHCFCGSNMNIAKQAEQGDGWLPQLIFHKEKVVF